MSKALYQPQSGLLTVQYAPDEQTVLIENPPRFTWIPAQLEHDQYILQYSTSSQFTPEDTVTVQPIPYNLYTPDHVFTAGIYYWRYALLQRGEGQPTEWSHIRSFTVQEGLPETPLPSRGHRYTDISMKHPRLWLQAEELPEFRRTVREQPSKYGWDVFMERSVKPWVDRELIAEPLPYPNNKRVAHLWRQMYIDCQEALYAVRHLSVAGVILEDADLIARAKAWSLHITSWNTEGTTSRDYNDEASFRIAGALAWGYDWLYQELTEEEREAVRNNLLTRTRQVAFHVIERSKIHHVPFDSHAVRSLSSVIVPSCMALLGEAAVAEEWLDYTLEYYACLYSPWGGVDGGWAEGPMYWTTGMAFVTEAMNLLNKYTGINFYRRPFFSIRVIFHYIALARIHFVPALAINPRLVIR